MRAFMVLLLVGFFAGPLSAAANAHTIASAFVDHPGRIEAGRAVDDDQVDLNTVLTRMARIAAIYQSRALGFTVDETTSVVTHDY